MTRTPLVLTGASGRLGRMLRRIWTATPPEGLQPIWVARSPGLDLVWPIGAEPAPRWPKGAVVLHLAGLLQGDDHRLAANARMIPPLLHACAENSARALLVASTAAVYAPSDRPATEDDRLAPPNPYGQSKLAMEQALADAPLPVCRLRIGNVAGADALLSPRPDAAPVVLDPVPGRDGGPLRSWIGPLSLAQALAALARQAEALPACLNVTQAPPLAMADLLQACGRAWHYGPPNPLVVPAAVMSAQKLEQICPLPPSSPAALAAEIAAFHALPPVKDPAP